MRAAVITAPGQVEVTTVDDPAPGPREVVIAVAGCGVCGTDLHILEGEFAPSLPIVPGHEFAGEVVAIGAEVTEVSVGDRVAADPNTYCGECYYCRRGRGNLCERFAAVGVTKPGAAAEYTLAPAANCFVLPAGVDPADAALIEPLSCAVHAYDVLKAAVAGHFLVYGAGTMGLMMMELAKHAGATTVSVVDINEDKLAVARELGCTAAVTSAEALDRARGWDVVVDCTGAIGAIEDGLRRVGKGGTFLQFGVARETATAEISPYRIYREEITIRGSFAVLNSYERAAELFVAGVLRPDVMVSHRLPLDSYPEALETVRAGTGRKVLVHP